MRRRAWAIGAAVVLALPLLGHGAALQCAAMAPPAVDIGRLRDPVPASDDPDRRELGTSWARHRGAIHEVRLEGTPEELGYANVALLYDDQVAIERDLHQQFEHFVPYAAARSLIVDVARLRFGPLDQRLSPSYRRELAAQAMAFSPDPFTSLMDTYPRFVFLHSLYDILLSFERSPLIGCTSFVLRPPLTRGHTLVGRNFDFEGPQTLDDHKAVFLILEDGHIPFASVSWPGFIGVTTGMNAEGLTVVLHGARAGETRSHGEPVAQTIRELLATTHTTREALALLDHRDPMVPHMLLVADGTGDAAIVERVPGAPPFARTIEAAALPLTNHLEGPFADDPKNLAVREATSTLPRRARLDERLASIPAGHATPELALSILRDKRGPGDTSLSLGHRHAIDALIATHSVVMDATARVLWVSEGPHATGRYIRFDLTELLDPDHRPHGPAEVEALPADPIVEDGSFTRWVDAGRRHDGRE